jgi:hypothetical protein
MFDIKLVIEYLRNKITGRELALVFTLALALSIGLWAPTQGQVIVFKICLVTLAALLGYWIDRMLFPNSRPHALKELFNQYQDDKTCNQVHAQNLNMAQLRRAVIVLATILGVCLGL